VLSFMRNWSMEYDCSTAPLLEDLHNV